MDIVQDQWGQPILSDEDARALLRSLLDLSISLPSADEIRPKVRDLRFVCRTPEDTFEEVFAGLRRDSLEVEISPEAYEQLTDESVPEDRLDAEDERVSNEVANALNVAYRYRLGELGLRPRMTFVRQDRFARAEIRFKLNDRTSPPIPIPGGDEFSVTVPPARLRKLGIEARALVEPVTGRENSAVAARFLERVEEAGMLAIPHVSYIVAALGRAVTPVAYRALTVADVEKDLAMVELRYPVLVHATLSHYTLGQITRLLRALAREQVAIRDLRRILDVLLLLADATDDDLDEMFPDDPLPSPGDAVTPMWTGWIEPRMLAFVRARLRDRICLDSGIAMTARAPTPVYETSEDFESLIDDVLNDAGGRADELLTLMRSRIWEVLDGDDTRDPILLTATRLRLALRRAIERELPGVPVLARAEIPAEARVQQLASITIT